MIYVEAEMTKKRLEKEFYKILQSLDSLFYGLRVACYNHEFDDERNVHSFLIVTYLNARGAADDVINAIKEKSEAALGKGVLEITPYGEYGLKCFINNKDLDYIKGILRLKGL